MLCSLVLVVNVMHFFTYITLMPLLDFISLMQFPCVVVSVECWTCKWYFALSLLACMSGCSFLVWMIIVVTIYSDCSFLVKPCFIASFFLLDRIVLAPNAFQVFCLQWSYCVVVFTKYLSVWFKSFTDSRVRYEWVLFNYSQLTWSLEFVLGFCHEIAKRGDCKVEFIQSLVSFISCQICL